MADNKNAPESFPGRFRRLFYVLYAAPDTSTRRTGWQ
jgi:hypothetical protein